MPGGLRAPPREAADLANVVRRAAELLPPTIADIDEPAELQRSGYWRMAVWALRVGYAALAVVAAGLVVLLFGSTPWVLAVGVVLWLAAAAVMVTGFLRARRQLPEPRPGFWSIRAMLLYDTVHARSSAEG
jgi:hypothetical protein